MVSAVPESSNKPATAVYEKNVVIMLSKGFFTTDSVFYTQAHLTVDAMAHDTSRILVRILNHVSESKADIKRYLVSLMSY